VDAINLDYEAIGQILRETCAAPINALALQIAANAAGNGDTPKDAKVTVKQFTTDRAIAVVMLSHPAAQSLEAKYGILKRAASAEGLEVKAK